MDALTLFRKNLQTKARQLADFDDSKIETAKITAWANGYCDACDSGDEEKKEIYASALMLKFWYQAQKMYEKTKTCGHDYEDYPAILFQCISIACDKEHRAWRKNPSINAQSCINRVIATRGSAQLIYESNLGRNKANVSVNQVSLDAAVGDDGASLGEYFGSEDDQMDCGPKMMIQSCLDEDKIIEAIFLDVIAFGDSTKEFKKRKTEVDSEGKTVTRTISSAEFWARECVQSVRKLAKGYKKYFLAKYSVKPRKFSAAMKRIEESSSTKLNVFLQKTLSYMRERLAE